MATIGNAVIRGRKAEAAAIELSQSEKLAAGRMGHAILLAAIVMLGVTMASHAFAAEHLGGGVGFHGGFRAPHMSRGFSGPMVDEPPSMPAPQFNPSDSYTVPQSPEVPVSPASPGSIFGNG